MTHDHAPQTIQEMREDDPAVTESRTRYQKKRTHPHNTKQLLKSGHHNSKIGRFIQKGDWSGMIMFTLTLEERATCSSSCFMWRGCYGNAMHMSPRHIHGPELEEALEIELEALNRDYPQGFVVRLHVLGDFYSDAYVDKWNKWLSQFENLHVYGYTHRHPWAESKEDYTIGLAIASAKHDHPKRFRIRWSSSEIIKDGATVIRRKAESAIVPEGQVCATYIDDKASCSTCAMCWSENMKSKTIVFPMHGIPKYGSRRKENKRNNLKNGR